MNTLTSSYSKSIECICPKCMKVHKRRIFWTGRGTPRIFCNKCKSIVEVYSDDPQYEINAEEEIELSEDE